MQHAKIFRRPSVRWHLPKGRWPVCARLSRLLPAALILTAALCCSSCRTTRSVEKAEAVTEEQREFRDSTAAMIRVVTKEAVPKSEASLRISVDSLLKLPEKASYHARSGQATAKVEKSGDTIYVSATCDSLAREVEYYQSLYEWECRRSGLYKTQYDELMEKRHDPLKLGGLCLLAGLLAGIYLVTTTNKNKKQ